MNRILTLLLLAISLAANSQTIQIPLPPGLIYKADLDKVNARIDSLKKIVFGDGGVVSPPPVTRLDSCPRGPSIEGISRIGKNSSVLLFDALGVTDINYVILDEGGNRILYSDSLTKLRSNTVEFKYSPLSEGSYYLRIQGRSCVSKPSTRKFTIRSDVSVPPPVVDPIPSNPKPIENPSVLGAQSIKVGSRYYTYNETPELKIQFNQDGSISDATEGLDNTGTYSKLNGWNVFYMIGYSWFEDENGRYQKFQNITLPDGPNSVRQFVCNPDRIPNYESFKKYLSSHDINRGVHWLNARMSQVFLTIRSDQKVGSGIGRDWLVVSRTLNFTKTLPLIDWRPYNKWIATAGINRGDDQNTYRRVGVIPDVRHNEDHAAQAMTFSTVKVGHDIVLNAEQAYQSGRANSYYMGSSPWSYITEEIVENGQDRYDKPGTLPGYQASYHFARGNLDDIRTRYPGIDKKNTGIFGGYGGDNYYAYLSDLLLYSDRKTYEESLTTKLYKGHNINGFTQEDHLYYTGGSIDVRNVNAKYYFFNKVYNLPYEFIALNERVKLATKTYGGIDRESNLTIFSCPFIESFVMDANNGKINIEQASSGELIHYPNGTVLAKMNSGPPMAFDEAFTAGFWAPLVTSGIAFWDAPRATFGQDASQVDWWGGQWIAWKQKGGSDYRKLESGKDGAPIISQEGLKGALYASPIDAAMAGMEAAWEIRNRTTKLSFISYESNRGGFVAIPGTEGYHLNGFGKPNYKLFVVKDAFDQKKAISLVGEGPEGPVLIYYNGFLSKHLTERVKIRYNGTLYDLGEVYGHQTVIKRL